MKKKYQEFGEYIAEKRKSRAIALREMARQLGFSAPFWSDVEKGRANPPKYGKLLQIAEILNFTLEEKTLMFDLAGQGRASIAPDIKEFIINNGYVTKAFRKVIGLGANENDWNDFINNLRRRNA